MLKRHLLLVGLVATLTITGCTDKTQEKAKDAANSAGQDATSAVVKTGEVVQQGAATTVSAVAQTGEVLKEGTATVASAVATGATKVADGANAVAVDANQKANTAGVVTSEKDVPEKQQY